MSTVMFTINETLPVTLTNAFKMQWQKNLWNSCRGRTFQIVYRTSKYVNHQTWAWNPSVLVLEKHKLYRQATIQEHCYNYIIYGTVLKGSRYRLYIGSLFVWLINKGHEMFSWEKCHVVCHWYHIQSYYWPIWRSF